ncbi:multicopper oxidase family protein [Azospirillum doebereinerae]|uniref:Copper oxidase n=1 Tax=Azospirillum doebereinerae TaxID=92933 RepID=A0A3S1CGS6_9PROT|nr:multicopper oxidase domain-containing protein [Azospirillum doebereinerae]RUQ70257.1 copper oxidase [Azospirillum doebereinerae]
MTLPVSRRRLLATAAAGGCAALLPAFPRALAAGAATRLTVDGRTLEVNGKAATVFGIRQPDGTAGLTLDPGRRFLVDLANRSGEDSVIHWHGQTPPYVQDGVADLNRPNIPDGTTVSYAYEPRPGTHWMHSHHGLQEQRLMAAPLIVRSADDRLADEQEVVVLLHDFTFRDPAELLAGLTGGAVPSGHGAGHGGGHAGMNHAMPAPAASGHAMHGMGGGAMAMDLNDVEYDAYLANDRTLDDPELVRVERGGRVRLRIINGATSTAFHIDLGGLTGRVIAVDGTPVRPVEGRRFGMTMGQRLDIRLTLPAEGGAFPILALREGAVERTGIVLASAGAAVTKLSGRSSEATGALDLGLEGRLTALAPLPARAADVTARLRLTGSMMPYAWTLDDRAFGAHAPLTVAKGQRVVLTLENASDMAHPMHLHGHHFQVVALNGAPLAGAVRDTVLVPVRGSVAVAFDADNPGRWPLHCHNLLHMATGMMTEVVYDGYA